MKLDRFINRPVLSTVISILIVILGILGLLSLAYYPISGYCPSNRFGESYLYGGKRTDGIE